MFTEFKKSIDNILHERISSPLFGSFLISWLVWNWKIIYLTIFISEKTIGGNKINFIQDNYVNINYQIWYPIISTILLIAVYPFFATGAYWVSLRFSQWRINLKNKEEKKQLLSVEQSIELREEIRTQEEKFDRLLKSKTDEINLLKQEIQNYRDQLKAFNENIAELPAETKTSLFEKEYQALKENEALLKEFEKIAPKAQRELVMFSEGNSINKNLFDYFLANDYIVKKATGIYGFTEKGKYLNKLFLDEKYKSKK